MRASTISLLRTSPWAAAATVAAAGTARRAVAAGAGRFRAVFSTRSAAAATAATRRVPATPSLSSHVSTITSWSSPSSSATSLVNGQRVMATAAEARQRQADESNDKRQDLQSQKPQQEPSEGAASSSQASAADATTVDRPVTMAKKKKSIRDVRSDDEFAGPPGMVSAPAPQPLRVTAFSTAEKYRTEGLFKMLKRKYQMLPFMADEIFRVRLVEATSQSRAAAAATATSGDSTADGVAVHVDDPSAAEALFFSNGTFVTWGATDEQNARLLKEVKPFEESDYKSVETEWFDYFYDMSQSGGMAAEVIIIGSDLPADQAKLAYASGMSRSVKLASLEVLLDDHLNKNRGIPELLLRGKKLPFGRDSVLRNLGELFWLRANVNLNSELLDNPEFCWSSARMEDYFNSISHSLDVRPRIAIFNKKLDYANEVAEVLRNHLHEQHSLKLEWCIIILISVEIGFECLHYYEKWVESREAKAAAVADAAVAAVSDLAAVAE